MKRMSLDELKELSIELAKEAYPSSFGLDVPVDPGLIEKDPRHVLLEGNIAFFIKLCDDFLVKSANTGVGVRKYPVLKFKEFITASIDKYLPDLDKHISSTVSSPRCENDDKGVVMVRTMVKDINSEGTKVIMEAFGRVKNKKHRRKFDRDLAALKNAYIVFRERADLLVEDVNSIKSNVVVRKDGK